MLYLISSFSTSSTGLVQATQYFHWSRHFVSDNEKRALRDKVKEMFQHAYGAYMKHAYPEDELMPLSCKGRRRGVDASRGKSECQKCFLTAIKP